MFSLLNIIITLAVGAVAGFVAARLLNLDSSNWVKNCLVGIVGSIVGSILSSLIGLAATNMIGYFLIALLGSVVALWAYNRFVK